eukprot:4074111-Amphidinium_carterae.1
MSLTIECPSDPSLIKHGSLLLCGALDEEGNAQGTLLLAFEHGGSWENGVFTVPGHFVAASDSYYQYWAETFLKSPITVMFVASGARAEEPTNGIIVRSFQFLNASAVLSKGMVARLLNGATLL